MGKPSLINIIKIDITRNTLSEKLYCCFHIHQQLMFGYNIISLHSASYFSYQYFIIMLVNVLFIKFTYYTQNYGQE